MRDTSNAIGRRCPRRGWRWLAGPLAVTALMGTASASALPHAANGGTVTFAVLPGNSPNWILPLTPAQYDSVVNRADFQPMLYRPLYWDQVGTRIGLDSAKSLAAPPRFSVVGGHSVATITLKTLNWSDGYPITTRDVQFWINLVRNNLADWALYVPGGFPSNVLRTDYITAHTFSITFNRVYNTYWLRYNELTQIEPIPQQVWDRTSAKGPVGNYDLTPSGATAVYKFLNAQASQLSTYPTNPLWKVVDGPWTIASLNPSTGYTVLARNPSFGGPGPRPSFGRLALVPYTNDTAEFNALRAGAIDYGYVPSEDVTQIPYLRRQGYTVAPWITWATTYIPLHFTNTTGAGAIFRQLYVRQAMQHLVDQPAYVRDIYKGYAVACAGPVPCKPASPFLGPADQRNPYPYSPRVAAQLLRSHGWAVHPNGTTTCTHPGIGPGACGAGIAGGAPLTFSMLYASGYLALTQEMEALKSAFSLVGIDLTLASTPFNTLLGEVIPPCKPSRGGPNCTWEMADWQNPNSWTYGDSAYPSGGQTLGCGSLVNAGDYCSQTAEQLIQATHTASGLQPMHRYDLFIEQQVPVLRLASPPAQIAAIRSTLHGVVQGPLLALDTQAWRLST